MRRRLTVPLLLVLIAVGAVACSDQGSSDGAGLNIVATTNIWGDVIENVVGDHASVEVLIPTGADSHDFQASAAQIARANEADLVVANGLGLEEGLHDVLDSAEEDGVPVVELAPKLDPLPFDMADDNRDASEGEDHGSEDPHVWFDPLRVAEGARIIAAELAELDPEIDWMARAEEYATELAGADEEISGILSSIPLSRRRLVTNHQSMGYFADRYDFEIIGVIIPGGSTMGDPSSQELAALIDVMRREDVRVIFVETTQPSVLAEAVADGLGEDVQVVGLYTESLGEPGSGADTLISMLTTNAELIAGALGG